jgi:ketosteroid isomerase-like protein
MNDARGRESFGEIAGLLARYANALDSHDFAAVARCFADDAVFEFVLPGTPDPLVYRSRAVIAEFIQTTTEQQADTRRHFVTNVRVTGQTATTENVASYLLLTVVQPDGTLRVVTSGRYEDEVMWSDGEPCFSRRRLVMDGAP